MMRSTPQPSKANEDSFTVFPVPAVIKEVYLNDFSDRQRKQFQTAFPLFISTHIPALLEPYKDHWDKLYKTKRPIKWLSDEDFIILHYCLSKNPVLKELHQQFNDFVFQRAFRSMTVKNASDSMTLFPIAGDRDNGALLLVVLMVGPILALPLATFVGFYYAIQKAIKSIANLCNGRKILRSLLRLASTLGGTAGGIFGGMALGALVGSAVPGIGTFLGTIIGGIAGSGIGAGLAALLAKHTTRLISLLGTALGIYGENIVSSTNPEKYRLNKSQLENCQANGITDTARIHEMLGSVYINKNTVNTFFDYSGDEQKNEYNQFIKNIKVNPEIVRYGMALSQKSSNLFIWTRGCSWRRYKTKPESFAFQYQTLNENSTAKRPLF